MLREENWYKVHFTDESMFNLFGSEKRMSSGHRCAELIQSRGFYTSLLIYDRCNPQILVVIFFCATVVTVL